MIRKFRIGPSLRIESRIGRTIRNRITKLRRSLIFKYFHWPPAEPLACIDRTHRFCRTLVENYCTCISSLQ